MTEGERSEGRAERDKVSATSGTERRLGGRDVPKRDDHTTQGVDNGVVAVRYVPTGVSIVETTAPTRYCCTMRLPNPHDRSEQSLVRSFVVPTQCCCTMLLPSRMRLGVV